MIICGPVRSNRQFEPCLEILKGEGFPSRILPPRDYCHTNLLSLLKLTLITTRVIIRHTSLNHTDRDLLHLLSHLVLPCISQSMSTPANKSTSTTAQPKQAPSTEQLAASHPVTTSKKPVAKVSKKTKKKPISPEIVPSEWDTSSEEETKSDKPKQKSLTAPELKKASTTADPFKSKKPIDQLIDKEVLKNLHIKKSTPAVQAPVPSSAPSVITDQANLAVDTTKNQPVDPVVSKITVDPEKSKSTRPEKNFFAPSFPKISGDSTIQKKIENYFVPQGRTTRSISSASSILPSASFTTEPYEPADSSDLDVITGATAQLWSKPKTSKAPLADDILRRYRPSFHPLLQAVKLQQEYYRRALETNDEDQKIVALRAASTAQTDLLRVMNLEEFLTLFENWNPAAEYQDYLTGQSGKDYWKKEGIPTTPSQAPEVLMRPSEANQEQPTIDSSDQPPASMNHPQGGYYYPPANQQAQQPYLNQPSYPVTAQGYQYPPPANYQHPTSGQAHQASATGRPTTFRSNQNRSRNRNPNRRRNQRQRGPDWLPRPGPSGAPQNSNAGSSREARRRSHQLSIHREMIRLNRTTQAQFQALESMRDQNAG
ncbi:hypothetical protein PGT21_016684 [Puccinia graminis f. sp. tritici]|uniref:Uncharacterized protein n=1 Tax=Puccinia graminis f. sp. tritici TaxID=56615 RepID=A0A5B0Q2X0_PUCGR|nr:hypothetical protein PGT21_016684 [Puccinia graminis f. sp. tritici]